jgi:hypothetical protein
MSPAELEQWRDALGGRRFWMTVGAGLVNTFLLWHGKIDMAIYRDLTLGTVAVYIAGATYQRVKGNVSNPTT